MQEAVRDSAVLIASGIQQSNFGILQDCVTVGKYLPTSTILAFRRSSCQICLPILTVADNLHNLAVFDNFMVFQAFPCFLQSFW
jgi:hypothetical protein